MNGAKIILALAKWLCFEPHPNGVRFTINRHPCGESWFLVERDTILVPFVDSGKPEIVVDGKRYVRVGGGKFEGKYVCVGEDTPEDIPQLGDGECSRCWLPDGHEGACDV